MRSGPWTKSLVGMLPELKTAMEICFSGLSRPPLSCGKAKYIVVLIHGVDSSANELIDLSMDWAPVLNKAEFVAPEIPWQDAEPQVSTASHTSDFPYQAVPEMSRRLRIYLDSLLEKRRLADSQVALVGFGEGASIALSAATKGAGPFGGIVAVGRGAPTLPEPSEQDLHRTPVLLVTADIGPEAAAGWAEARKWLERLDFAVEELTTPGDYFGLDEHGILAIADYLRSHLAAPGSVACD